VEPHIAHLGADQAKHLAKHLARDFGADDIRDLILKGKVTGRVPRLATNIVRGLFAPKRTSNAMGHHIDYAWICPTPSTVVLRSGCGLGSQEDARLSFVLFGVGRRLSTENAAERLGIRTANRIDPRKWFSRGGGWRWRGGGWRWRGRPRSLGHYYIGALYKLQRRFAAQSIGQ
jgi:hypothetical protein